MAGNRVAANLLMLLCLIGGAYSIGRITQEVFPDIVPDIVVVSMAYPGAGPEEVERGIVLVLEDALENMEDVEEILSVASEGSALVHIKMSEGGDLDGLARNVRNEVDRISIFPEDAEKPKVAIASRRRRVLSLLLHGNVEEGVLRNIARLIRDRLTRNLHVGQVEFSGVRDPEIRVEISRDQLRRYGLTVDEVAERIRLTSLDLPAGGIKAGGGEVLVRLRERRDWARYFADIPLITGTDGSRLLLGHMADLSENFDDTLCYAAFNGQRGMSIDVYRSEGQTPIQVSRAVRKELEALRPLLPLGIHINIPQDRTVIYRQRVELLLRNGAVGLIMVLIILGLFLEIRLAFWVMMGIPISFMGTLLLMPSMGVSLNVTTLFAFIVALGIVVDDAIVVGENIYHYRQSGLPALESAIRGAAEVSTPVIFSILTNMATFLPLYFIPGIMGKIFKFIPVVVCIAFAVSLFESLFILPAHLNRPGKTGAGAGWLTRRQQAFSRWFSHAIRRFYLPSLIVILRWRYVTVCLGISVLALSVPVVKSGRLGFALFPKVESDQARVELRLPYGVPVERTEAAAEKLLAAARRVAEESGRADELVRGIYHQIGRDGSHHLVMRVYLAPPEIRDAIMSTDEFTNRWRKAAGPIAGAEELRFESDFGGPGRGPALTVELSHRNIKTLDRAGADLAARLAEYSILRDINDGFQEGKRQVDFRMKPSGEALGMTTADVARQVRDAWYGREVMKQQRGGDEVTVMIRRPESERKSLHDLEEMILRTPAGGEIMLRDAAEAAYGRAYTRIERRGGRRNIQVTAEVTPRSRVGEIVRDLEGQVIPELKARYPGLETGYKGKNAERKKSLDSLKENFIIAMLVIYGLLAVVFRSYAHPLVVMSAVPFGVVGAIIGHKLMGYALSVVSILGIVALSGVIVNDSLVMVDFANRRRQAGCSPSRAILAAGVQRFRPVFLTTVTTFGGLMPMISETSRQARFLIPMAISLGFGILFATLINLVLVPCLYLVVEDLRPRRRPFPGETEGPQAGQRPSPRRF
ncbi:MAG: cobalt-zinc-cadmium resistance protein [Desulfobacterales bacterium]|nr:MAG: cobalt-zinc-cadmium resistance protein [Desulfobacterales bacterium]